MAMRPIKKIDIIKICYSPCFKKMGIGLFTPTETQTYINAKKSLLIIKPVIGSIMSRYDKDKKTHSDYVVIRVYSRKRGINKGVTDRIELSKIVKMQKTDLGTILEYDDNNTIEFTLTNHGNWGRKSDEISHIFQWDIIPNICE